VQDKLVLITDRKLHIGFRLVQKSVTLNDLEQHNSRYFALISVKSAAFGVHCVKCLKIYLNFLRQKC